MVTSTLYSFGRPASSDSETSKSSGLCPTASRLVASSLARATNSAIDSVGAFLRLFSSCLSRRRLALLYAVKVASSLSHRALAVATSSAIER